MSIKSNVTAVVTLEKSGGAYVARARDLGLIFLQKSVVDKWMHDSEKLAPTAPLYTGQWVVLNLKDSGEESNPKLGKYRWRALSIVKKLRLLPDVERAKEGNFIINEVPVAITTCFNTYGFLYSEALGRINMDSKSTVGFDRSKLPPKSFAKVSVRHLEHGSGKLDYFWTATKIVSCQGNVSEFPSIHRCEAKLIPSALYDGHGKLQTQRYGTIFFSYNDYYEDVRNRRPLKSFMLNYTWFNVLVVPALHGFQVSHRAVYVKPSIIASKPSLLPTPPKQAQSAISSAASNKLAKTKPEQNEQNPSIPLLPYPVAQLLTSENKPQVKSNADGYHGSQQIQAYTAAKGAASCLPSQELPKNAMLSLASCSTESSNSPQDEYGTSSVSDNESNFEMARLEEELGALLASREVSSDNAAGILNSTTPQSVNPSVQAEMAVEIEVQTDPLMEKSLINDLMSDVEIFETISTKRPDLMKQLVKVVMQRF